MELIKAVKVYDLKAPTLAENCIKGAAGVMGNLDDASPRDVIFPGAFVGALAKFRKAGFVAVGHDYVGLPVAMPTLAEERGNELYTEAEFHSTPDAQAARTVCMERHEKGLRTGLSIGFGMEADGYLYFESGKKLLAYAKANGYDLSLFDTNGIGAWKSVCRAIVKVAALYEYSIVTVPANPKAGISDAKNLAPADVAPEGEGGPTAESPEIKFYGAYMDEGESTAADATVAALNSLYWELCDDLCDILYDPNTTVADKITEARDEFTSFTDNSIAVIEALMTALADADDDEKSAAMDRMRAWSRTACDALKPGDFARAGSVLSGQYGDVLKVTRSGAVSLPGGAEVVGTEDDPAVLLRLWSEDAGEWQPTDGRAAHKLSALTKTGPLRKKAALSMTTPRRLEKLLRDAGLSRREAVALSKHGFNGLLREAEITEANENAAQAMTDAAQSLTAREMELRQRQIRQRAGLV